MASVFRDGVCQGRVALVAGGGSGIGHEIARQLGLHGASVVLLGRRREVLDAAEKTLKEQGIRAASASGDVRKQEDAAAAVKLAVDTFGHLDILVNAAAGNFLAAAEQLSPNGFRTVMDIDTVGTFTMCHAAFPELQKCERSTIINISANLHLPASWYQVHASAAKAAIDSLTRSLALEWGSFGIRVTGIAPGPIADTPGMLKLSGGASSEQLDKLVGRGVPVGRMGTTQEIALTAVFLVTDAGGYISGTTLLVDGGQYLYKTAPMPRETIASLSRSVEGASRKVAIPKSRL